MAIVLSNYMEQGNAVDVLLFLALPREQQIGYLPDYQDGMVVIMADGETSISFPAEALLRATWKLCDALWEVAPNDTESILWELLCVIDMTLIVAEHGDYVWLLDKQRYPIEGPFDDAWIVVRRLSRTALDQLQIPCRPMTKTFLEIIHSVGYSVL